MAIFKATMKEDFHMMKSSLSISFCSNNPHTIKRWSFLGHDQYHLLCLIKQLALTLRYLYSFIALSCHLYTSMQEFLVWTLQLLSNIWVSNYISFISAANHIFIGSKSSNDLFMSLTQKRMIYLDVIPFISPHFRSYRAIWLMNVWKIASFHHCVTDLTSLRTVVF